MKKTTIILLFSFSFLTAFSNGHRAYLIDKYYFEFKTRPDKNYKNGYRYYRMEFIPETFIKKTYFKHIKRIELIIDGTEKEHPEVDKYATKMKTQFNESKTYILAQGGEDTFILTPDYHLVKTYSNVYGMKWVSDTEFIADVEGTTESKYGTYRYRINFKNDSALKIE